MKQVTHRYSYKWFISLLLISSLTVTCHFKNIEISFPKNLPLGLRLIVSNEIEVGRGEMRAFCFEDRAGRLVGAVLPWDLVEEVGFDGKRRWVVALSQEAGWMAKQILAAGPNRALNFNYLWAKSVLEKKKMELPYRSLFFFDEAKFRRDWVAGRINSYSFQKRRMMKWNRDEFFKKMETQHPGVTRIPDWEFIDWESPCYLFQGPDCAEEIPIGVWTFVSESTGQLLKIQADPQKNPPLSFYLGRIPQ